MENALVVRNLRTQFFIYEGIVRALEDISFTLRKGEILGIVGETGCGKSVTAYSIARLIPDPPGRIVGGEIMMGNLNLLRNINYEARIVFKKRPRIKHNYRAIKNNEHFLNRIRGKYISMIFQEPMASLNPVYTVEDQIAETLILHNRTRLLKIIEQASENLSSLERFRSEETIGAVNSSELGEELEKIRTTGRGKESVNRHLDLLIEIAKNRLKKKNKYDRMMAGSKDSDALEERLLAAESEEEQEKLIRRLFKDRRKVNLVKMSKKMKRGTSDPLLLEARRESLGLLESVEIPNPYGILKSYPHELSGGMLQRVTIAIALANGPRILIADEPTTALDVTVQAQILNLLKNLQRDKSTSIILITHDLGVIAETCDRVAVMYAGNIVENADADEIFHNPKHPYTIGLLQSIPRVDVPGKNLKSITGNVPDLIHPPDGCRFNPRCPFVFDRCRSEIPVATEVSPGHTVECHLFSGKVVNA
jgi:oligopeptide/dipeptide ABC transporter ATP-binding protein